MSMSFRTISDLQNCLFDDLVDDVVKGDSLVPKFVTTLSLLLSFDCFLLNGEMMNIKKADCMVRNGAFHINLGLTRSGKRRGTEERVTSTGSEVLILLFS